MIMSNKLFNVGDVVRIIDWQHGIDDMKHLVGLITSIKDIAVDDEARYWYHLNDCRWHWREDWLETVNKRDDMETML